MNSDIQKLYDISRSSERRILGLMSGTSVDGLDMALCNVRGSGPNTNVELVNFKTEAFDFDFKDRILSVLSDEQATVKEICLLNPWIATHHAEIILNTLSEWGVSPSEVDLIASHGQSVYHAPQHLHQLSTFGNSTLQIGDGDHIATQTGIITLSDFRQKQIAAGGEGAPLAMYGDYLLFRSEAESRVLLNLGGISNMTYLPRQASFSDIICSDLGPGNTMMDAFAHAKFGIPYDKDAKIAQQGSVHPVLLRALKDHPFLSLNLPKTTGPELFNLNYLNSAISKISDIEISDFDIMRTLLEFAAMTVAEQIKTHCEEKVACYMSGGGIHNPLLVDRIVELAGPKTKSTTAELGIDPDAKEAVVFAVLANESIASNYTEDSPKDFPWVSMGKISLPR